MEEVVLGGHCLCGDVRWEARAPVWDQTLCHCSMCRRASGAPVVAWFTVAAAAFRFVAGQPARYQSSARATRTFCPRCGTALTFQAADLPDEIDVTICSLADPERVAPLDHTHVASGLSWLRLDDGRPRFPEGRSE